MLQSVLTRESFVITIISIIKFSVFLTINASVYLQKGFQIFLVLVALVCVPWMLVAKPYIMYKQNKSGQVRHKMSGTWRTVVVQVSVLTSEARQE